MTQIRAYPALAAALAALSLAACSAEERETTPDTPAPGAAEGQPIPAAPPEPEPERSPTAPSPDAPYVGVWAGPQASCDNRPGSGEAAPIQITRTDFIGYENRCEIRSVTRTGEGYEAVMRCTSEGETSSERLVLGVNADTLDITYSDRDDMTASFVRCPY